MSKLALVAERLMSEHREKLKESLYELLTQHVDETMGVVMFPTGNAEVPYRCRIMQDGETKAVGTGQHAPEALAQALQDLSYQRRAKEQLRR